MDWVDDESAGGEFIYQPVEPAAKNGKTVILYHSWLPHAEAEAHKGHHAIVPKIVYNDSWNPLGNMADHMKRIQWKAL